MANWLVSALFTVLFWGTYQIFGNNATALHGEKVTMTFEAVAMVALALIMIHGSTSDFHKVTLWSAFGAALMGVMSAGGFYMMLRAMSQSPENIVPITIITAMYPAVTVLVVNVVLKLRPEWVPGAMPLTKMQFIGVVFAIASIILINWKPEWGAKLASTLKISVS